MKARLPKLTVCLCRLLRSSLFAHPLKKRLLIAAGVLASLQLQGQGAVNFSNIGLNAPVIDPLTCANAVGGTTFSVALYWAPVDPLNPTVQPDSSAFAQQGASVHLGGPAGIAAGIYVGGTRIVPGIMPPGGLGWFQVKVWQTAYGLTYEQAAASGQAEFGASNIILIPTGNPASIPPTVPHELTGLSPILAGVLIGFNPCVPEPSPVLLGLLGAAILLFSASRHRNK